mmetsp:Transcript_52930/g.110387  ORF Transcript_52930/g.110387 Transcript_52930/m.110387 type:complete len:211 (-) Transcript_52930:120-752(-)
MRRAGCIQQAQLIRLSSSNVCSTKFSRMALHPLSTSICESPARRSIFASPADEMVALCRIFHLRALFRPILSLDFHVCNHGWTQSGLLSVLNCIAIHNTRPNSSRPTMPRSCIFLFAGNLPSESAEEKENSPRLQRRRWRLDCMALPRCLQLPARLDRPQHQCLLLEHPPPQRPRYVLSHPRCRCCARTAARPTASQVPLFLHVRPAPAF